MMARCRNIGGYANRSHFRNPRCGNGPVSENADTAPSASGHAAAPAEHRALFRSSRSRSRRISASCQKVSCGRIHKPPTLGHMAARPSEGPAISSGYAQSPPFRPLVVTLDPALQNISRLVRPLCGLFARGQTAGGHHVGGKCSPPSPSLACSWR